MQYYKLFSKPQILKRHEVKRDSRNGDINIAGACSKRERRINLSFTICPVIFCHRYKEFPRSGVDSPCDAREKMAQQTDERHEGRDMKEFSKSSIDHYILPNRIFCSMAGMWPVDERSSIYGKLFAYFRLLFAVTAISSVFVPEILAIVKHWGDLKILAGNVWIEK